MLSAGNDIVSFAEIDVARTNTKQFYSKILSGAEMSLYEKAVSPAIPFEKYVWLLWSVKEAAYKFLKRIDPELVFTPVKFEVKELDIPGGYSINDLGSIEITKKGFTDTLTIKSIVETGSYKIYIGSVIYTEFISSVANNDEDFDEVYWGVRRIEKADTDSQSAQVREFLISNLSRVFKKDDLTVIKNSHDIPVLFEGSKELQMPVSLAHHGYYVGYSFKLK